MEVRFKGEIGVIENMGNGKVIGNVYDVNV